MTKIRNPRSIIYKIHEFRQKYIKDHGKNPNIIYLDPEEREDLRKACGLKVLNWPVDVAGMQVRKTEEYTQIDGFIVKKLDVFLKDGNGG